MTAQQTYQVDALLQPLPESHRRALAWFVEHADTVQPWPKPLPDDILLATKAKGIYKPRWSPCALSIREVPGQYPDRPPEVRPDGSWTYTYHQENLDPEARDIEYANRALMACREASVPVGVMRRLTGKPRVRYHILGLALVDDWGKGYFTLSGLTALSPQTAHTPT